MASLALTKQTNFLFGLLGNLKNTIGIAVFVCKLFFYLFIYSFI